MANFMQRKLSRTQTQSGLSSEWDVVSEGALHLDDLSAGSLPSQGSDAVIIFGGQQDAQSAQSSPAHSDSLSCSAVLNQNIQNFIVDQEETPAQLASNDARLLHRPSSFLSAGSDLVSEPGRKTRELSMPIEQRLLDQITKLAEELDASQEQVKLLLLQNERLMYENDDLKQLISMKRDKGTNEQSDTMRVTVAVAAGLLIIGFAKKKIMFNSMGLLSSAVLGSCFGWYHLSHKNVKNEK
mmetsp:Transcript_1281/g.2546  ORF Transcript_1281/g.2546 Transcript_1281/m.2546 type:complete len:240 (-) Transcript_1281:131-850(-)|eukprot:CAMPEP_0184525304 /NCGR_PEP_ID=MMETSP0198_2-20121128/10021_1 /TAXON_ID=1112570 /ORGANISM="Thraustochytrium sp., Strain LLF1b" /LENGTH=239 /DNA_ID=CAMNT_0026916743 /DNA_START=550 /DNA_END=1269 /DNA_ORIENTATION=-